MPINKSPSDVFPGYVFADNILYFPVDSFPGLRATEVHPTRGDWRKLLFSLCATTQDYLDSNGAITGLLKRATDEYESTAAENSVLRTYRFLFTSVTLLESLDVTDEVAAEVAYYAE